MKNYLSFSNSKLKRDGIFTWGLPAGKYTVTDRFLEELKTLNVKNEYKPGDIIVTCPNAGLCASGCYAMQAFYVMPSVKRAQETRLALSLSDAFVDTIDAEIKRRGIKRLRIHDSADFFSLAYTNQWIEVMRRNPGTKFYAYTKMVTFFKARQALLPANFHVVYSQGGTQDAKIDISTDRHSAVFGSLAELKRAKYSDASKRDLPTFQGKQRIGLVYHGAPSRQWRTA